MVLDHHSAHPVFQCSPRGGQVVNRSRAHIRGAVQVQVHDTLEVHVQVLSPLRWLVSRFVVACQRNRAFMLQ
ncbi:MAG TPA: hypothetical protein DCP73_01475 [Chloroflexi bacterium]|nr:hypothetical protein [Chloroflexota bacterium]